MSSRTKQFFRLLSSFSTADRTWSRSCNVTVLSFAHGGELVTDWLVTDEGVRALEWLAIAEESLAIRPSSEAVSLICHYKTEIRSFAIFK